VVGVILVVGCALAFTDASLHLGSREEVLVVAQALDAGQVLTTGDLRAVRVSTSGGLDAVLVGEESSALGRRASVPLVEHLSHTRADGNRAQFSSVLQRIGTTPLVRLPMAGRHGCGR
jgi:hypothetical protein